MGVSHTRVSVSRDVSHTRVSVRCLKRDDAAVARSTTRRDDAPGRRVLARARESTRGDVERAIVERTSGGRRRTSTETCVERSGGTIARDVIVASFARATRAGGEGLRSVGLGRDRALRGR